MGIAGKLAQAFIRSKLTPIIILVSLALGSFSVLTTPKEEEPQIVVPMIDIFISYPGATPEEVERRVVTPLEKKLWELKDIEYIYSASMDGMAIVTARFYVGTDPTKALVDLNTKMMSAMDLAPPGVMLPPLIKPKSIDDVPILTLTIWGKDYDWYELRRIASSIENEIKKVNNVADVFVVGGRPRQMKIILDPNKLSSYKLSVLHVANAIRSANSELSSGKISQSDRELYVRAGEFLKSRSDIENLLVAVIDSRPVFIKDIATVEDGPEDISNYVFMGLGPAHKEAGFNQGEMYPAVSIAVAKRVGTNAVNVAKEVLSVVEHIKKTQLPADLKITVTRNYGETAEEKANTLIKKLLIATFSVILLMAVALGVREAIVVGIAVPVTLAIAMFLSQVFGFTINRVTLFALIFAIGILVDDAIVVVENIHRWFELKLAKDPQEAIVKATDEVGNPTVLATFTVIAALMPMAFVSGLMGPYMRPIPINASVAMFFSLIVAFIITPWASYILLRDQFTKREAEKDHKTGAYWRFYSSIMAPMLASNAKRYAFYGLNVLLLMLSIGLLISKAVVVKMLPYDNKSEVQVVLDMPEGTSLERTLEVAKEIANIISKQSLVSNYQIYVGTSSPFNFNGLVRHYYLRNSSNLADIQINLIHKDKREEQSHDFAKKLRPLVREVAFKSGAKYVAVVEVPPGPPVLSPVVAEVYAPELKTQESVAREVLKIFKNSKSVTDEGIYLEDQTDLISVIINQEKLLKAGLNKEEVVITLQSLFGGKQIGIIQNTDTEHTPIVIKMDEKLKSIEALNSLKLISQSGNLVPLSEVVELRKEPVPSTIYHKNLRRVNYVIGDVAGREEAPFYAVLDVRDEIKNLQTPFGKIKELWLSQPVVEDGIYIKWDGEMHITLEVFRDLGLAFAIALFVMYVLILGWFKDFKVPGIIMAPIPLTLVGIVPGHLIMGAFFTATSMIGFIALAGIIVRNSILLVDFAQHRIQQGVAPHVAVVESGVIRTRPIVLTAVAIIVGAFVLVFDPIFNGLAISIIFGTIGSTILTLFLIPLMYYASKTKGNNRPSKEQITKDLSG